ncbi:MAG: ABC transporter ATP-binding protein, partial [Anaerolineae bacterium]|nr:ABC transporter ATP-binding protein [Anaerolineae bacterium]
ESGCGKSVTSLSILQLVGPPGKIVEGEVKFVGQSLLDLTEKELVTIRGNNISMIFQQPQSSLNPVFTIGSQIEEVFLIHHEMKKSDASREAINLLRLVGIPDPERKAKAYPHELSGGQAQRVMIAMALALNPQLLIADEPTTALDVTIQAQILDLMQALNEQMGTAVILITHDLGVISEMADRVAVMYAGRIVEQSNVTDLFQEPHHPYTQGLINSIPVLGLVQETLGVIPGSVPNLINLPSGCTFSPRCTAQQEHGMDICFQKMPDLVETSPGRLVRCWLYQNNPELGHKAPIRK